MIQKTPISEKAVAERVKRRLAREGETLHKCRTGVRRAGELGTYFIVDRQNNLVAYNIEDIEPLAREVGALREHECIAECIAV